MDDTPPRMAVIMKSCSLAHASDADVMQGLLSLVKQDRVTTAEMLAHISEVDARRLYLPAAYASMFAYCVGELHMSEACAFKRIRAARAARRYPGILTAVADGRLHLAAVMLLAPYLTSHTAEALLKAAQHMSKAQVEHLLAGRFPRPDVPTRVGIVKPDAPPIAMRSQGSSPALPACAAQPAESGTMIPPESADATGPLAPGPVGFQETALAGGVMSPLSRPAKLTPLAPERYAVQVTVDRETYEMLQHAKALLGHAVPSGDIASVLKRALASLVTQLERRRCAKVERPRAAHPGPKGRHVPAEVRREVWRRDAGCCSFVSSSGRRCESRTRLELDHVRPVALGGESTAANLRLRCRAHNQYAADRVFGAGFMQRKRSMSPNLASSPNSP